MAETMARTRRALARVFGPSPAGRWVAGGLLLVVVGAIAFRAGGLDRPGYSVDEELTCFSCLGISDRGIPVLPSGMVYGRGLLYTYTAWLSGSLFGQSIESYRYPALLAGIVGLVLSFLVARRAGTPGSGLLAALLVGLSPLHAAVDTWARFYSMFLAVMLGAMLACPAAIEGGRRRVFLALVAAAGLLHEFAPMLVALPLCEAAVTRDRLRVRRAIDLALLGLAVLTLTRLTAHVLLTRVLSGVALPPGDVGVLAVPAGFLASASPVFVTILAAGATGGLLLVVKRLPLFGPISIAGAAALQFGSVLFVWAAACVARPRRIKAFGAAAAGTLSIAAAAWLLYLKTVVFPAAAVGQVLGPLLSYAVSYPTAAAAYTLTHLPLVSALSLASAVCVVRAGQAGPEDSHPALRAQMLYAVAWLIALGVVATSQQPRYRLPLCTVLLLVAAHLPRLVASSPAASPGLRPILRGLAVVLALGAVPLLGFEQAADLRSSPAFASRPLGGLPTLDLSPLRDLADALRPTDVVVCNDELACLDGLGRVDYWLVRDARPFAYQSARGWMGIYGGRPVLTSLDRVTPPAGRRIWVVVIGSQKFWTPDARELRERAAGTRAFDLVRRTGSVSAYLVR
jgi:hypothetical protein